jgi:hypothetical protein
MIRSVQRLHQLDRALGDFLSGKRQPAGPEERLELASFCRHPGKRLYAASGRFYAAAFAARPALAYDRSAGHRYQAACCAALAGCGRGEDATRLTEQERARLRKEGLAWLRADLAVWRKQVESANQSERAAILGWLTRWQEDPSLADVREAEALNRLPGEERTAWRQLWADVTTVRQRAEQK